MELFQQYQENTRWWFGFIDFKCYHLSSSKRKSVSLTDFNILFSETLKKGKGVNVIYEEESFVSMQTSFLEF